MRDLKAIKGQRDQLVRQYNDYQNVIRNLRVNRSKTSINEFEERVLRSTFESARMLSMQISALNFVLNEDIEVVDVQDYNFYNKQYGIGHEEIMVYFEEE